jgi:hypothetical protein
MPTIAQKVTVDLEHKQLFIDGVEFPWYIAESGVTVDHLLDRSRIPVVMVPLEAVTVEVIPEVWTDGISMEI